MRTEVDVPFKQQHGETTRDVDVAGIRNGGLKLRIVECKAEIREKALNSTYVRKVFHETLPAALQQYSQAAEIVECEAEIWTNGRIGDDAEIAFRELKTDRRVRKRLREYASVMDLIPKTLKSSRALLAAISGAGLTN